MTDIRALWSELALHPPRAQAGELCGGRLRVTPKSAAAADSLGRGGEGFEVVAASLHRRKLPRGAIAANRLDIRVPGVTGNAPAALGRLCDDDNERIGRV